MGGGRAGFYDDNFGIRKKFTLFKKYFI